MVYNTFQLSWHDVKMTVKVMEYNIRNGTNW